MKTLLRTALALGLISFFGSAFGQTPVVNENRINSKTKADTHLGILLNMVNTNLNYGDAENALGDHKKSNRGLQAGLSFQGAMTSRVSLLSEFYFLMKGGQLKANNALSASKSSLRFYSLEMPVLARVHFGKFYVNAGPSVGYNLSGKKKIEGTSSSLSFNNSPESFKRFEAAVQMGGGYRFRIKQKTVLFDIRYSNGLTNISQSRELYNRYLNVSLQFINPWKSNPLAVR